MNSSTSKQHVTTPQLRRDVGRVRILQDCSSAQPPQATSPVMKQRTHLKHDYHSDTDERPDVEASPGCTAQVPQQGEEPVCNLQFSTWSRLQCTDQALETRQKFGTRGTPRATAGMSDMADNSVSCPGTGWRELLRMNSSLVNGNSVYDKSACSGPRSMLASQLMMKALMPFSKGSTRSHMHMLSTSPIHASAVIIARTKPRTQESQPTQSLLTTLHTLTSPLLKSPRRNFSLLTPPFFSLFCSHALTARLVPSHSSTIAT